jgi:hypothetical protein
LCKENAVPLRRHLLQGPDVFWYCCLSCGFSGTGLDYLAALEHKSAAKKLAELIAEEEGSGRDVSLVSSLAAYKTEEAELRQRWQNLEPFRRDRSSLLEGIENLETYFHAAKYRMGDRSALEALFQPRVKKHNTSKSRLFHGKNWSAITAIPLYDMPLRMSGVLLVNGSSRAGAGRTAIKRLGPQTSGTWAFDPGYLSVSQILPEQPKEGYAVCSPDWKTVLRLQADACQQTDEIIPLLGWFPVNPQTQALWSYRWTFFRGIPRIFWSDPEDIINLREACLQESWVSHAYFRNGSRFCELPPTLMAGAVIRSICKQPVPWHRALTWYLEQDRSSAEARLKNLSLPLELLDKYLRQAPPDLRKTISPLCGRMPGVSRYLGSRVVLSSDEGWFQESGEAGVPPLLLSSARCLVERAVRMGDGEPMYQGRVLLREKQYPFLEYESSVERDPIGFIRSVCAAGKSEYLPVIQVNQDKMRQLIRNYGHFQVTHIPSGFGWDDRSCSLLLPNMTISDALVVPSEVPLGFGPFSCLKEDHAKEFTKDEFAALASFREDTPYFLALLLSLLPPLFAPAYRTEPPQTVVPCGNIDLLRRFFRYFSLPVSEEASVLRPVQEYIRTQKCPLLIKLPAGGKGNRTACWADSPGFYGFSFVAAPLASALARMSYGTANLLFPPKARFYQWLQGDIPDVYRKCLVRCLRFLSRYVLSAPVCSENWNSGLIEAASHFIEQELKLPLARNILFDGYYDPSSWFCDYVTLLRQTEDLVPVQDGENLILPVTPLSDCYRKHVGMFDFDKIKAVLSQAMILKHYDPAKHLFVLDKEPFEQSSRRFGTVYSPYVRK